MVKSMKHRGILQPNFIFYNNLILFLFVIVSLVCVVHSGTDSSIGTGSSLSSPHKSLQCTSDCLDEKTELEIREQCPEINNQIFRGYYPKGNISAGVYKQVKEATTIESCAKQCCALEECNFVFMYSDICYLLSCSLGPDPCVPTKVPIEKEKGIRNGTNVSMLLIRNPTGITPSVACEVGVTQCGTNEECIAVHSRSRNGMCQCQEGFVAAPAESAISCIAKEEKIGIVTTNSPPSPQSSTVKTVKTLEVSVISKNVSLPENDVSLFAYAVPQAPAGQTYSYEWTLISHPTEDLATIEGQTTNHLHLMLLKPGSYIFQVNVKSPEAEGSANASVNVLPEKRMNLAPIAVISPPEQTVQLPTTSVVLDASASTDDDKIVSYKWELQKGPIEYVFNLKSLNSTTLQVENLIPGNYTFKLTVEDADHVANFTTANIAVIKETDYPPTAIAGKDIVIYLPQTEVTLNGNASTDDKKIVQWEWKATGDLNKAVDMQDTHTPYLKLSHLQEGLYQFELKVTDEAGQSATSTVHVFVKQPSGNPPKANAGVDQTVTLPQNWAVLDASESKADGKIVKWQWIQLTGPTNATILNSDQVKANVSGLTKGEYEFQVELEDEAKLADKSVVKVIVMQKTNERPTANAGGDKSVTLPFTMVQLNGSGSKDDVKIMKWKWERQPDSLAAGVILGETDTTPVLELTGLVPGKYVFKLIVKDEQGLSNEDIVTLTVKGDVRNKDLLEIIMAVPIYSLTDSDKEKILQQMTLLVHDTRLVFDHMRSQIHTEYAVLILHGINTENVIIEGTQLAAQLRQRLHQDDGLLQFPIVSIDTVECLDMCSGHGVCQDTPNGRQCICDAFWMENFLKKRLGNGDRNCEWSKIYVGVVTCLLLMMVFALLWSLMFLFRRNLGSLKDNLSTSSGTSNGSTRGGNKRYHVHKKQYTLLDDDEIEMETKEDEGDDTEDSDSDILFETKRPKGKNGILKKLPTSNSNGLVRNGILKQPRRIKA